MQMVRIGGGESFGSADTHAGEDVETGSPGQTHQDFALRYILKLGLHGENLCKPRQSTDHRFIDRDSASIMEMDQPN